jgi:hypothetical protein
MDDVVSVFIVAVIFGWSVSMVCVLGGALALPKMRTLWRKKLHSVREQRIRAALGDHYRRDFRHEP